MLTLNQLKNHLFDILPKFIFTVDSSYDFKAVSDVNNRISFFNDLRTFHLEVVNKEIFYRNAKEFILPLMIEISHEAFSHIIIRYANPDCEFPLLIPIKGRNKFLCPNDYGTESGFALEYFFADDYQELKFLKTPNTELILLLDQKYWTDTNFNKMKEFNRKVMEKNKFNNNKFFDDYEDMFLYDKKINGSEKRIGCVF